VLAETGGATFTAYDQIDKAPEEKALASRSRPRTSSTKPRTGTTPTSTARPRRLCEEHDHGRRADGCAILVVSAADGPMPQTREHILLAKQVGVPPWSCSQQVRHGRRSGIAGARRDGSSRTAVEYDFPGDDIPIVKGSALAALEDRTRRSATTPSSS